MTLPALPIEEYAAVVDRELRALQAPILTSAARLCELATTIIADGLWRYLRRADGRLYDTEESYLDDVFGAYRSAARYLRVGKMLRMAPERARGALREAIATVGVVKADILTPLVLGALEAGGGDDDVAPLWATARTLSTEELQAFVSQATGAKRRGPGRMADIQRVLERYGSIEDAATIAEFFRYGALEAPEASPWAILMNGLREASSTWAPQVVASGGRS
jgi:hypothetical protein